MATMRTVRILALLLPAAQSLELHVRTQTAVSLRGPVKGFYAEPKNATKKEASPGREKAPTFAEATEHADDNLCDKALHFPLEDVKKQAPEHDWSYFGGVGTFINSVTGPDDCALACALIDGCAYFVTGPAVHGCAIYANCTKALYDSRFSGVDLHVYAMVGSRGDPHLRNLAGEKFDVNQPADYLLLRVPKQLTRPALLELRGAVRVADDLPCGLYLKNVTLAGEWLGGIHLEVRSLKGKSFQGVWPNGWPFAMRTLPTKPAVEGQWRSWEDFTSEGSAEDSLPDTVKVTTRFRKEVAAAGRVMQAQAFELHIGSQEAVQERASIIVAQGSHEGLDISLAKMSSLDEHELGGLLGTDMHDKKVENRTAECEASLKRLTSNLIETTAGGSRFTASWV